MKTKELKRLSRAELLEMLLEQTRQVEQLRQQLAEAEELLASRKLMVTEAGDLAHAVLAVNRVMEAAQAAADQYLQNAAAMEIRARAACEQMLREAREEADRIRSEAAERQTE